MFLTIKSTIYNVQVVQTPIKVNTDFAVFFNDIAFIITPNYTKYQCHFQGLPDICGNEQLHEPAVRLRHFLRARLHGRQTGRLHR